MCNVGTWGTHKRKTPNSEIQGEILDCFSTAWLIDYFSTFSAFSTLSTRRVREAVRASGCLGVQSSGGNATRQKAGRGSENSRPISALPSRTGPRNTTWHSCSSSVMLCFILRLLPLVMRFLRATRAPWALMARVSVFSSKGLPCASLPRICTPTCIKTRWLRRRTAGLVVVLATWLMTVSLSLTIRRGGELSRGLKFAVYKNDTAGREAGR